MSVLKDEKRVPRFLLVEKYLHFGSKFVIDPFFHI
jgi:hypothetical protein